MDGSDIHRVEIDGAESLLVRVDTSGKCRVIADELEWRDGLECCDYALMCVKLDQEVDFLKLNHCRDIIQSTDDYSGGATLFHLKDVGQNLAQVLILQQHENH